jgi:1-aminocyclopropane-1-carboxylate deaminase/D-cysteine desulfhydrase-like pyridoxal-dependent ACC family enzyme
MTSGGIWGVLTDRWLLCVTRAHVMAQSHDEISLLLFNRFPRLRDRIAWTPIGQWPTPVLRADDFGHRVGLASLHLKREDLSHPDCGGNKTRGLEFLIARAVERGAECIVTCSSAGSHHISKTAWHAKRFGIDTVAIFLDQPVSEYVRRNLATALSSGARYILANKLTIVPKTLMTYVSESFRRNWAEGSRPVYFIAPGGTNTRSMLGHVNAALELKTQVDAGVMPAPDYIFVVMGSLGTAAGVALGLKLAGLSSRVVGVTVSYPWYCTRRRLARFARRANQWMRRLDSSVPDADMRPGDFDVVHSALGEGYALFTPRGESLARMLYEAHGVRADGAYTAKALDGMMQYIEANQLSSSNHLFWHTYFEFPPCELAAEAIPASVRRYFETPIQPWTIEDD